MNASEIEEEARCELNAEATRRAINLAKERIRANRGRSWWRRLFPYHITITRT